MILHFEESYKFPYEEFDRLMIEYGDWSNSPHHFTDEDTERELSLFLPVEEYLKKQYLTGTQIDQWNSDTTESYRFRHKDFNQNLLVHRHFRYDWHMPHVHEYFQLNYVLTGSASMLIEGTELPMTEGDFFLLPPGTMHTQRVFCDDCMVLKYYIRSSTFDRTFYRWLGESNTLTDILRNAVWKHETGNYLIFRTGQDKKIRSLMISLYTELFNSDSYCSIVSESILTELFCRLTRGYMADARSGADESGPNVGFFIKYIHENRGTATLGGLAKEAGYSKNYLCRILMKSTGHTFLEILNAARVEAAEKLLATTDLPLSEVGARAGFTSEKQFSRVFGAFHGVTPRRFRELAGKDD